MSRRSSDSARGQWLAIFGSYLNSFNVLATVPKLHLLDRRRLHVCLDRHIMPTTIEYASQPISAERRLQELAIDLPVPPEPFGTYTEAVQAGSLLFLSGPLPTEGRTAKFVGPVGAELDVAAGREAARLAPMNAVAITRQHLGWLDRVKRIVRLGVSVATEGNVSDLPKVADGAPDFLQDVFGPDKNRLVYGAASHDASCLSESSVACPVHPVPLRSGS